jgi:hypothetical protein
LKCGNGVLKLFPLLGALGVVLLSRASARFFVMESFVESHTFGSFETFGALKLANVAILVVELNDLRGGEFCIMRQFRCFDIGISGLEEAAEATEAREAVELR